MDTLERVEKIVVEDILGQAIAMTEMLKDSLEKQVDGKRFDINLEEINRITSQYFQAVHTVSTTLTEQIIEQKPFVEVHKSNSSLKRESANLDSLLSLSSKLSNFIAQPQFP